MLDLTTSLNIVISNQFHEYCMQLHVKVSEIWCTSVNLRRSQIFTMMIQRGTYHWASNQMSYLKNDNFLFNNVIVDLISSFQKK